MDEITSDDTNVEDITTAEPKRTRPTQTTTNPNPPPALEFTKIPPRDYDTEMVRQFLQLVFGEDPMPEGENILTWGVKPGKTPSYPGNDTDLYETLDRVSKPLALYYGTATCARDDIGQLRNRQALFKRLYVIVLDDIGTKIPKDRIPKAMTPTYIVESSKGNEQWGFVFVEPIENLEASKALVQLVYEAGVSDAGGKMPNKLVRLPEGVNGKDGDKRGFITRLVHMSGPLWTPVALLKALGTDITWEELSTNAENALKRTSRRASGTSPWSPQYQHSTTTSGIIDPVAEWLYSEGLVYQESLEGWITIECPWADQHTGGDSAAGYSPIGSPESPDYRGFNCFHEHCKTRKTNEFLAYIVANGGPEVGVRDHVGRLVSQWVYDAQAEGAWDVKTTDHPQFLTITSFRMVEPHSTRIQLADGSTKTYKDAALWTTSPGRVTVYGRTFQPSTTARLVMDEGRLKLNSFAPPAWGSGEPDNRHISMFTHFIDYLIPGEADQNYFLNWLAAKVQNMGFRGAALLMIAKRQGTGRTTLGDMITQMFEKRNVEDVPFSDMLADRPYNEWMESPIVITNETMAVRADARYKAYEHLKDMIDPRTKKVRINPKYGKQRIATVHSSFLFFSNHEDALAITHEDRRFYVIENAPQPETPEYFNDLNAWLDELDEEGRPVWARHIWWWLSGREVNMTALTAPPATTDTKLAMMSATDSPIEVALDAALGANPNEYVVADRLKQALESVGGRIGLYDIPRWELLFRRLYTDRTTSLPGGFIVRVDGKACRVRLISDRVTPKTFNKTANGTLSDKSRDGIRAAVLDYNLSAVTLAIEVALDLADF